MPGTKIKLSLRLFLNLKILIGTRAMSLTGGQCQWSRKGQEKLLGKIITKSICSAEISETSFLESASEVISDGSWGVGWVSVTVEQTPIVARMFYSSISAPFSGI